MIFVSFSVRAFPYSCCKVEGSQKIIYNKWAFNFKNYLIKKTTKIMLTFISICINLQPFFKAGFRYWCE